MTASWMSSAKILPISTGCGHSLSEFPFRPAPNCTFRRTKWSPAERDRERSGDMLDAEGAMSESTIHTYEYSVDLGSDTAAAHVVLMTGRNKKVLEIGAGPGSITRHLSGTSNCDVVTAEIDSSAIEKLRPFCRSVYVC